MRKKETTVLSARQGGPRLGRNSSKGARTTALRPSSCIGAQTYSSETHSGGSHVCRHQQGVDPCRYAPPFLQPNEVLGGAWSAGEFMQYLRFFAHSDVGYTSPDEDQPCWPWVTAWQNATEILIALRSGRRYRIVRYGNHCPTWHPSSQQQANTNNSNGVSEHRRTALHC